MNGLLHGLLYEVYVDGYTVVALSVAQTAIPYGDGNTRMAGGGRIGSNDNVGCGGSSNNINHNKNNNVDTNDNNNDNDNRRR